LETTGPNTTGSRQTDRDQVTQRPKKAGKKKDARGLDNSGNIEGNIHATVGGAPLEAMRPPRARLPGYSPPGCQPEDGGNAAGLAPGEDTVRPAGGASPSRSLQSTRGQDASAPGVQQRLRGARPAVAERGAGAKRRRRVGEKGLWNSYPLVRGMGENCLKTPSVSPYRGTIACEAMV
jgi:hypothetical protein